MAFHSATLAKIQAADWVNVAIQMGISFAFWWIVGYFTGGSRWAAATLGATISGIMAVANGGVRGTLPDKLGVVSINPPGYTPPQGSPGWNLTGMAFSVGVTFTVWYAVGMFVIKGSAWKYASTAAVIAAISAFLN